MALGSGGQTNITVGVSAMMDVSNVLGAVKTMQGAFNGLKLPSNLTADITKDFEKLKSSLTDYRKLMEKKSSGEKLTKSNLKAFDKLEKDIDSAFSRIMGHYDELSSKKLYLEVDATKIKAAQQEIDKLSSEVKTKLSNIKLDMSSPKGGNISLGIDKATTDMEKAVRSSKVLSAAMKEVQNSLSSGDFSKTSTQLSNIYQQSTKLKGASTGLLNLFKQWGIIDFSKPAKDLAKTAEGTNLLKVGFDKLIAAIPKEDAELQGLIKQFDILIKKKSELEKTGTENYTNAIVKQEKDMAGYANAAKQATDANMQFQQSAYSAAQQVQDLQQSTQYFFSLRNMINLLKRGIDQAVQSVKDLDKAMTETAVVTDFNVSDMWGKLPEYTELANELGATTQGAYETMTLYYQQGLDTNQAFEIGAETMKMARIAGLEYKDATDMMTAALRGFNMELDETSAKNVNDVYSKLAAITASDTREIGEAMERTASIAHSAGMSFEGTSAFLAQMIETTREAPENLGTAMKTIVARFQEMKENPLEIAEVDGEEVSYNKIDKALKTIGVDLKDTNGQFRELDQVFLDIAQRWDGLSQVQQRYIATTAAGSRQQSRFIAMMNNYDRTMQLMEAANDSAGASDEQFGKTMESLEAKLNKLHNAWQEFTMGIANSGMIKTAVDGLTGFLNITNRVIEALSLGSGTIKSFLSVFAAFTGLKAGGKVLNSLIGGLGGLVDPTSSFGAGFSRGMTGNRQAVNAAQAAAIYQPIVSAINNQTAALGGEISEGNLQRKEGAYDRYNSFKDANQNIRGLTQGSYNSRDLINELSKYDRATQRNIMRGLAGTELATTQSLMKRYSGGGREALKGISQTKTQLRAMRNMGQLSDAEYFRTLYDPRELLRHIDNSNGPGQAAETYLNELSTKIQQKSSEYAQAAEQSILDSFRDQGYDDEQIADIQETDQYKEEIEKARKEANAQATHEILDDEARSNTGIIKTLDNIGKVGAGVSQFGMAIQGFSSLLMNSANPAIQTFGSLLNSLGSGIASLGMGISGVSRAFSAVAGSNLITSLTAEGGVLASLGIGATAATGGLFALAAAIAAVVGIVTITRKNIKEEAQKLTDTYKERSEKNQTNIANLQQWREELATLSKGVDENGLNINLDPSDYARYQEIIDGIAEISPELVQGYNLQGHAIVNNNQALEQSLSLEKQRAKEIAENYTNTEAWVKLLDARNLQKVSTRTSTKEQDSLGMTQVQSGFELKPRKEMQTQLAKIGQELKKNKDLIDLSGLNVDIDALARGEEQAFNQVLNNLTAFRSRVNNAIENAGDDWSEHSSNAITKAFSSFSDASAELEELIQPMYESLSVYASETGAFDNMAENLKGSFQKALKDLAQDANIDGPAEMREAVDNVIDQFSRMGSEYNDIMAEVDTARKNFADNFNETEYQAQVEEPIADLEKLKKAFEGTPGESALTQWVDNEIDKIRNHISSGSTTIESAWDTLSEKVVEAEGAYESFSKQTEKDYSTAADGMKQIREAVVAETDDIATHMEGFGDKTYWTGVEGLFGDLRGKSKKEIDGMIKDAEGMLQTGQAGFDAFYDKVVNAYNNGAFKSIKEGLDFGEDGFFTNIDESVNPEVFQQIADALGMSEDFLTSMLNKGRQFMEMDFTNFGELREALGNDNTTLRGRSTVNYGKDGKTSGQTLYMTQQELKDLMGHEYYQDEKRGQKENDLLSQAGIKVLKDATKFKKSDLKDLGINSLKDAVNTLGQKYDEADLKTIAEKVERANAKEEAKEQGEEFDEEAFQKKFDEDWQDYYPEYLKEQEYPTLQPLQSIESLVAQIAGVVAQGKIKNGGLTEDLKQSDDIREKVFGGEGVDTLAQHFFRGEDVNGNKLTEVSYSAGKNELEGLKTEAKLYLDSLEKGLKKDNLTEEQKDQYNREITATDKLINQIGNAIEAGTQSYLNKNKPEEQKTDTVDPLADKYKTGKSGGQIPENSEPIQTSETDKRSAEVSRQIQQEQANKTAEAIKNGFSWLIKSGGQTPQETVAANKQKGESTPTKSAADNLANAADSFTTAITSLQTAGTALKTAGTQLSAASSNLNSAAAALATKGNKGNEGSNTTVPGVPKTATNESSVSGTIVVDNSGALANLDAVYKKATETTAIVNEGATYTIKVPGLSNLTKASTAAKNLTDNAGEKSIKVKTDKVDTKNVDSGIKGISKKSATISVKADTKTFTRQVNSAVHNANNKSVSIDVSPSFAATSWTHDVHINVIKHHKSDAKGQNNNRSYPSVPTFGSAAKGRYGTVGPKNKGGLTLTGEEGFEIAWLPSESRSMILGAEGPQMTSLPADAVVYTHEQSVDILKQKSIPAGSHALKGTFGTYNRHRGNNSSNNSGGSKQSKKNTKDAANNNKKAKKVIEKAGKLNLWWENMTRKVEATQRKIDNLQKSISKIINKIGTTLSTISEDASTYIAKLKQQIDLNTKMQNKAQKKLVNLDKGSTAQQTARANLKKAKEDLKAAKKTKSKKDDKTAEKDVKKQQKKLKKANKKGSDLVTVSYQTGGKKNKTKKKKVNLNKYISIDNETGAYIVNEDKIKKDFKIKKGKNKGKLSSLGEAIGKKANELIDKYQGKANTAEDNINKAQDALEEFSNQLYEIFYEWKSELDKLWNITQKINLSQKTTDRLEAYFELLKTQSEAGMGENGIGYLMSDVYGQGLTYRVKTIQERTNSITEQRKQLENIVTGSNIQKELDIAIAERNKSDNKEEKNLALDELIKKLTVNSNLFEDWKKQFTTITQFTDGTFSIEFNEEAFNEARLADPINKESYEAFKTEVVDAIVEGTDKLQDTYSEQTSDLTYLYSELQNAKESLASTSDSLLSALEEQQQKELNKLKQLSDSLTDTLKELLDEVKKKLDERRQQEDNAKTEADIAKKQQRLALLRADTAGGHAVEIAQLEKELQDAQQSYGRTLEDQALDKLQKQGDEAVKQRERQIKLQEALIKSTNNIALVNLWMSDPDKFRDQIIEAYKAANDYEKSTINRQAVIIDEANALVDSAIQNRNAVPQLTQAIINSQKARDIVDESVKNKENKYLVTEKRDDEGKLTNIEVESDSNKNDVVITNDIDKLDNNKNDTTTTNESISKSSEGIPTEKFHQNASLNYFYNLKEIKKKGKLTTDQVNELFDRGKMAGYGKATIIRDLISKDDISGLDPFTWKGQLKTILNADGVNRYNLALAFGNDKALNEAFKTVLTKEPKTMAKILEEARKKNISALQFKQGGLASYTGPAWLDGTPSKPELVLNAKDTENFIALKDVLSKAMGSINSTSNSYNGYSSYEININVDHINNDYDVDKIAARVEKKIVKSSNYRNVTQVRKFR